MNTGTQGAAASSPSAQKPSTSGQFTNIQNYINANQNSNLGQKTEDQFNDLKQTGENALGQQQDQFNANASQTGQAIQQNQQNINNAISGISTGNQSDADFQSGVGALQNGMNYQYNGPTGLSNTAALQNQASNLSQLGGLTNSAGGRFTLLQKFFNTPTYSQGQTNLDNLLLGSQPQALQGIRQTANTFGTDVNNAQQNAASQVSQLQNQGQQLQQSALGGITTAGQDLTGQLGTEAQNFTNQEQQLQNNPTYNGNLQLSAGVNPTLNLPGTTVNTISQQTPLNFNANLTPQQAAQLGLLQSNSSIPLSQLQADPSSYYGQIDPTLAARYNTIAALNPTAISNANLASSYGTGTQANIGQWNLNNQSGFNQQYTGAVNNVLGQAVDPTLLSQLGNLRGGWGPDGTTYQQALGDWMGPGFWTNTAGQQQGEAAIQNAISQAALQNVLSNHGVSYAPSYGLGMSNTTPTTNGGAVPVGQNKLPLSIKT